jgi:type I restriction enzyme S subunit
MIAIAYRASELVAPSEWTSFRIKDVTTYVNRGVAPDYSDDPTDLLAFSQKCVHANREVDPAQARFQKPDESLVASEALLRPFDVVINSTGTGTLGRAGLISSALIEEYPPMLADGHVTILRFDERLCRPRYGWYLLSTDVFYRFANEALAVGSTNQMELGREALRRTAISLPPVARQDELVDWMDDQCGKVSRLLREIGAGQAAPGALAQLLAEHREALVTAAVTGQLDLNRSAA